jgi:site-specific recombinase XerD
MASTCRTSSEVRQVVGGTAPDGRTGSVAAMTSTPGPDPRDESVAAPTEGPANEVRAALRVWADGDVAASTLDRLGGLAERFALRLEAAGVASVLEATAADCDGFIWARTRRNTSPSLHTVHLRRTALRGLFRALQHDNPDIVDPTTGIDLPSRNSNRVRALTSSEMELVRTAALGRSRQPLRGAAAVALAEATATTGEVPQVEWRHVSFTDGVVTLSGADPIQPRVGTLTAWGIGVLHRWQHQQSPQPHQRVIPNGSTSTAGYSQQAAIANLLSKLLSTAGLYGPDVRPGSIRLWGARQQLDRHGIEAAATALGVDSLDVAAAALGHQWQARR